ncbi:MAG: hypothetical protein ACRELD_08880 [Longimicrobiales bacterium]
MNRSMQRPRRGKRAGVIVGVAALALTGCDLDSLLEVDDPDTVNPATLEDPAVLDVVIAGAKGDFTLGYDGTGVGDRFIAVVAAMSDEVFSSGTFPTRTATDRRDQFEPANGNTSDAAYVDLQQARRALKDAAARVAEVRGTDDPAYPELRTLEGFTYVALGEGYCSPIPFSNVEGGEFVFGEPIPLEQVFGEGIARFDDALSADAAYHPAAIGKGRALLNLGRFAEAATAVSAVPTSFNYFIHHSVSGATNPIYSLQGNGRFSVSDREGTNGQPFRSADDPRAPWFRDPNQPNGFDQAYALFKSLKYTDFTDPVVLASGVEARLIEAEAALQAGDAATWLSILNALRADVAAIMNAQVASYPVADPVLAPLVDPGTTAGRRDIMFSERAFWLYLTGHRLGDLRRLMRQYGLTDDEAFPTGDYHKGGTFGDDVAFPLDFDEQNNENYSHDLCDVTSAG